MSMDNRGENINRLLSVIKSLEESVVATKDEDTLSFSFFKDSFSKTQEIMEIIHKLEMLQIEDMKHQMEKLIYFLSETKNKIETQKTLETEEIKKDSVTQVEELTFIAQPEDESLLEEKEPKTFSTPPKLNNKTTEFILPTYSNPLSNNKNDENNNQSVKPTPKTVEKEIQTIQNHVSSVNDVLQAPQSKLDVKHGLSINDRFYFQRELFGNNRDKMNLVMTNLNNLSSTTEIENYLKENTSWNFDNEDVKNFIDIITKGLN